MVIIWLLFKMIVGKVLCLFGLFTIASAYISTCTELSWQKKTGGENFSFYNAGNKILMISSAKINCFADDKKFVYTNEKSLLLNPGQKIHLPGGAWMSNCSATFCSACLMYRCDISVQINQNATLVFFYDASNSVDIEYSHLSRVKKFESHTRETPACPSNMISIWATEGPPTVLIDMPNHKKRKTVYTIELRCDGPYLLDHNRTAIESFNYTTAVMRSKEEVIVKVPLQTRGEIARICTMNACLHKKSFCNQKFLCAFKIPNRYVELQNITKWRKPLYDSVGCSQTQWTWSIIDQQTGNLNLQLYNRDWTEKLFRISMHCQQLSTLNDSLLVTIPPMVHTKIVTFPLTIYTMKKSTTSTKCVVRLCNMAKQKCGRNTECPITLPVKNGKFVIKSIKKINTRKSSECKSKSVMWSPLGRRRGIVSVKLLNSKQESIITKVFLNCSELDIIKAPENSTLELPANSLHTMEFKVRPSSVKNTSVETNCSIEICNNEDCLSQGTTCILRVPVTDGLFLKCKNKERNKKKCKIRDRSNERIRPRIRNIRKSKSLDYKRETSVTCSSDVVSFYNSSSESPVIFVNVENAKRNPLTYIVNLICNNIYVIQDNGTVSASAIEIIPNIHPQTQEHVEFRFQNNSTREKTCTLDICIQRSRRCSSVTACEITFVNETSNTFPIVSNNSNGISESCDPFKWTWTVQKPKRGTFEVVLRNDDEIEIEFGVTLQCDSLNVINNSVNVTLTPMSYNRTVSFRVKPLSLSRSDTVAQCMVKICKEDCVNRTICNVDIPVDKKRFVMPTDTPTTMIPIIEEHHYKECKQKNAVWEATQAHKGVLKVKAYNPGKEGNEGMITLQCRSLRPINNLTKVITVPGKSFRPVKFKFRPMVDPLTINDTEEAQCLIHVCSYNNCTNERWKTCTLKIPITAGKFVIVKPPRKKVKNETKFISHRCHNHHSIHSLAPCHNEMWNLLYTPAQLEGEALLMITLNMKPNNQFDLRINVSLNCEGIIIEDDAQKILLLSKYEKQRNVTFGITTIRSLDLERHVCVLTIHNSLFTVPEDNVTNDAIRTLCPENKRCSIAIDSRLGRIIPKCNFHGVHSLIDDTKADQKTATVSFTVTPSLYNVFTYDAYCSKNNPFAHDSMKKKNVNSFVSQSEKAKVVTVDFSPDCNNDTIHKEFENYRKENCNFFLYGYCQGGELLLEKLEDIQFDDDKMYCTPKLVFNRWLQNIQKHTGIHNKPMAAILTIFITITLLLVVVIIPVIIMVYFCFCRRHRVDGEKRQSIGIVISSCDEWEEANEILKAMSIENSKFLIGRSDQKLPDCINNSDNEIPIYQYDGSSADQHDRIDQSDSMGYHDPEDQHDHHKHIDQHDITNSFDQSNSRSNFNKHLEPHNESLTEEQNSKLSVTRTDFSSTLDGWGDEEDDGELQSTKF